MHPFHLLLWLFAAMALAALVLLVRWERGYFTRLNKGGAWLAVRISTIPIALAMVAIVFIPTRVISGMEALFVSYVLLLTVVPLCWFGGHWLAAKILGPSLKFGESMLIAASPIALGILLVMAAHTLQPMAWSILRTAGLAY